MKNFQTPKLKNQRNIKLQPPVVCERAANLLKSVSGFLWSLEPGIGSFQRTVLPHQQKREYMNHQIVWCDIPVKDLDRAIILDSEGNRVALHAK